MAENPWRDPARKSAAGLGMAAARAALARPQIEIRWDGKLERYWAICPTCELGAAVLKLSEAEAWALAHECKEDQA